MKDIEGIIRIESAKTDVGKWTLFFGNILKRDKNIQRGRKFARLSSTGGHAIAGMINEKWLGE